MDGRRGRPCRLFVMWKILLFISFFVFLCGCNTRRHVVERRSLDSVAVVARSATEITGRTRETEYVHEIIVMERDTATGSMVETRRRIVRTRGRETVADTSRNETKQTAVVAVEQENEQTVVQCDENAVERKKTRFWRIFGIVVFVLAATGVIVLFLYAKFWTKWISRN